MNPCDFCSNEGLTENSSAYCASCGKYMCVPCGKSHAKFLPEHILSDGTVIPNKDVKTCKQHIGQVIESFCENDFCLLCKVCKLVEHKQCAVRKIDDVIIERHLKQEFETNLADLVGLRDTLNESQDKTRDELEAYTKRRDDMKERIDKLQRGLNGIFDTYKRNIETTDEDVDMFHAKLISYQNFHQRIESHLRSIERLKLDECDNKYIFASGIELKQIYVKGKALSETLKANTKNDVLFTINDTKLPSLIRELNMITKQPCIPLPDVSGASGQSSQSIGAGSLKIDQACQTDINIDNRLQTNKENADSSTISGQTENICSLSGNQISTVKEVEQGSSEEMSELPDKICFDNIKACTLLKEVKGNIDLTNACAMANGEVVVCESGCLKIFDKDMALQYQFDAQDSDFKPKHVVAVDNKSVFVSMPQKKILQLLAVIPNIEFGKQLQLTCHCDDLACFEKQLYVYTENFEETSCFKYSGFYFISLDGTTLCRMKLLDTIRCFNVNKDGNIIYFGCQQGTNDNFIKCVSKEGYILFKYATSAKPNTIISDYSDNSIICCPSSGKVNTIHCFLRSSIFSKWPYVFG